MPVAGWGGTREPGWSGLVWSADVRRAREEGGIGMGRGELSEKLFLVLLLTIFEEESTTLWVGRGVVSL
jgi:hypothetical protein